MIALLVSNENKVGTIIVSRYGYSVNELGQRESVTTRSTAFPALPSWVWGHDGFGLVTSADSATYQYDALGRRTKRSETIGGVTTDTWFFANGWNVELEHNGSDFTRRLSWGLDLTNSLQGAGGVGGLVMTEELPSGGGAPIPHFPTYDGNGNITAWINAGGSVVARQRYDAFGNIVEQTGTAPSNYGFSTKPIEKLTGFLYYTYRWYDPLTGRWPSRDPIEEEGGMNLYGFVENDGVNRTDYLGQFGSINYGPGFGVNPGQWPGPNRPVPPRPPPPTRCPATEPEGDPKWRPQSGIAGNLSECVFHGGNECYREDVATSSAQCCYDESGNLVDGDEDRVNPDYDFWGHLTDDVIPHFF